MTPEDLKPDFVMVPREPSDEMRSCGGDAIDRADGREQMAADAYRAMIAAAPPTPSTEALRVENERLRTALKPFAEADAYACELHGKPPRGLSRISDWWHAACDRLKVRHFEEAARALLPNGGSDEG